MQHFSILDPEEVTVVRHIPVTTVARTLFDLAAVVSESRLERALREAEFLRLLDLRPLCALLARHPRRPRTAVLRRILARGVEMHFTRSELARRFIAFLARAVLPPCETNVWLELNGTRVEVDCLWREQRVALELDGRQGHDTATAFERDRRRDRALIVAGWRPVRVTWRQLEHGPEELERDLRTILGSSLSGA